MCMSAGSREKEQEGDEEERREGEGERERWGLTMGHSACVDIRGQLPGANSLLVPWVFESNWGPKACRECVFIAGPFHWPLCKFFCPFTRWILGHSHFSTIINSAPVPKAVPHSLMLSCLLWMDTQKGDYWRIWHFYYILLCTLVPWTVGKYSFLHSPISLALLGHF